MSEEEEEAIERLKILECDCTYFENGKCTYSQNKCQREQDIETALNLIQKQRHRLEVANEYIESRKDNMIPEHYDDLKYILNECDLESTW